MNVAAYLRVSTEEQNLDNQRLALKKYGESRGWKLTFFEEKESTRKTRPVKNEVYMKLMRQDFDALLIYKFDRWARSSKELLLDFDAMLERNIGIYSYTEAVDLTSSMGRAMLTIMSAFAQLERDLIRERTLAGLERAKAQGKKLGRPKGSKDKNYRRRRSDRQFMKRRK